MSPDERAQYLDEDEVRSTLYIHMNTSDPAYIRKLYVVECISFDSSVGRAVDCSA